MELHHNALRDGRLSDILKNEMHVSTGLMNRLKTTDRILVGGVPRRTNHAVLAGDTVAAVQRALVGVATIALQKELLAFPAALPADGLSISSHYSYLLRSDAATLGRTASVVGDGHGSR